MAEWSKALVLGTSPQGRGFETHRCQIYFFFAAAAFDEVYFCHPRYILPQFLIWAPGHFQISLKFSWQFFQPFFVLKEELLYCVIPNAHILTPFFQKIMFFSKICYGTSKFLEVCLNSEYMWKWSQVYNFNSARAIKKLLSAGFEVTCTLPNFDTLQDLLMKMISFSYD